MYTSWINAEPDIEETSPVWETLPDGLDGVEAEPGVDGYGESIDYESIASEAIDQYILQSLEARYHTEEQREENTLSIEEDWALDAPLVGIKAAAAPDQVLAAVHPAMPEAKAYQLQLDNRTVYAWFPDGATLGVSDDGYIYNASGSNITGVIADNLDGIDINGFNDTVTITPLLNSSGNNNAYRYGSRVYITDYYTSGSTLQNTVSYVQSAQLVKAPGAGYGFSSFQLAVYGFGLLLVLLLVMRFIRK